MSELELLIAEQQKDDTFFVMKQFNALPLIGDGVGRGYSRRNVKAPNLKVPFTHGTPTAYMSHKCRCLTCRTWRRDYARQERIKLGMKPRNFTVPRKD